MTCGGSTPSRTAAVTNQSTICGWHVKTSTWLVLREIGEGDGGAHTALRVEVDQRLVNEQWQPLCTLAQVADVAESQRQKQYDMRCSFSLHTLHIRT